MAKEIDYSSIKEMKEKASVLNQSILNLHLSPNPNGISVLFRSPFSVSLGTVHTEKNGDIDINFALGAREFMEYDEIKDNNLVFQMVRNGVALRERYIIVGMKLIPTVHGSKCNYYGDDCVSYYPEEQPIDVEEIIKDPSDFSKC